MNVNEKFDIMIFAGQSNMSGRGDADKAAVCDKNAGFEYKAISCPDRLCHITEPFGLGEDKAGALDDVSDGVSKRTGSMVSAVVDEYYKKTGRRVVAVSASKGGTNTVQWLGGLIDDATERIDSTVRFLEANGMEFDRVILVWCQGESDGDAKRTKEDYIKNTELLFDKFRKHGVQKIFIVQTGHYNYIKYPDLSNGLTGEEWDEQYEIIRQAQEELCRSNDDYILAGTLKPYICDMKDVFHYNQTAYNSVGKEAGSAIAEFYKNNP